MTTTPTLRAALEDALNTVLWLERRLPRGYGEVPHVKRTIAQTEAALALTQHDDEAPTLYYKALEGGHPNQYGRCYDICFVPVDGYTPLYARATPPAEKASAESVSDLAMGETQGQKPADHAKRAGSEREQFEAWWDSEAGWGSKEETWAGWQARGQQSDKRADDLVRAALIEEVDRRQQAGDALDGATDAMLDAGGEALYGHPRSSAIEWVKEDKFDSCVWQAGRVWDAMCAARASAAKEGEA